MKDINRLLIKLEATDEFREWRELVEAPELEKIRQMKINVLGLSEADVKAMIIYENLVTGMFRGVFDQARLQVELEEEQKQNEENLINKGE